MASKMKKGHRVGLLAFSVVLLWLAHGTFARSREGVDQEKPSPPPENARFIYESIEAQLAPGTPDSSGLPLVKEDGLGRTWAAWEEWQNGRRRVGIGRLDGDGVLVSIPMASPAGSNFSPDIAFGPDDSPWAAWGNYSAERYSICVQDVFTRRRWRLNLPQNASLTGPKIVFDGSGFIRVFWNETWRGNWQIVSRTFDGKMWSPPTTVFPPTRVPTVNPDVVADGTGSLWLAWSVYDGRDYEIYVARSKGKDWVGPVRLTDNEDNDLFPSLGIGTDRRPAVSWERASTEGVQVFATALAENGLFPEVPVSPPLRDSLRSRIISLSDRAAVVWKSAEGLGMKDLSALPATPGNLEPVVSPVPQPVSNIDRDENAYIGFGDSITYGYIDRLPAPELGYPPRLDAILDQNFGPTEMINEGLGAEKTPQGLIRIDSVLASHAARYILIMEGTNDVINMSISMDTSVFNIREMARKSREAGTFPTLTTIIPRRDWAWPDPQVRSRQAYLNGQLRLLPAELLVSFIDMDLLFLDYPEADGGLLSLLSNDLKHPSEKGYQFMAESWFEEISDYPFPPYDIRLRKRIPKRETPEDVLPNPFRVLRDPHPRPARQTGNFLTWKVNPKISDPARIKGYNIYRASRDLPGDAFRFLAFVPDLPNFIDSGFEVFDRYDYLVSTIRDDDVEGPCAGPVER